MNCKDVQELLPLHVGGDLAAKKSHLLRMHLGDCGSCAASAAEYSQSFNLAKSFEPPVFGEDFYAGIRQDVLREIRNSVTTKSWFSTLLPGRFRPEWAVAAMLVLVLFGFYFITNRHKTSIEVVKAPPTNSPQDVVTTQSPGLASPIVTPNPLNDERPATVDNRTAPRKARHLKVPRLGKEATDNAQAIISPEESVATSPVAPTISEKPLRVEMQTKDSNIRIIWFTYQNAKQDSPGKGSKGV